MANAVLVVDMLRGFLEEGHPLFCGEAARGIIPHVQKLLERGQAARSTLFYICDEHDPDDLEFQVFPLHCVRGTPESEVISELGPYPGVRIAKRRYSGFFGTELDVRLEALRPEKVIVCGVCTDICVLHTVADARNRDYVVEVPVDCVASFDQGAHEFALEHMERVLGARLVPEG